MIPITRRSNALARCASRLPMPPNPMISKVLPPSSSSRFDRSLIIPRQTFLAWLSRASGSLRASARRSDIACSETARWLTPLALASLILPRGQLIAGELIGAGADRLDEAELLRLRQQIIAPQSGHHQHVGVPDLAGKFVIGPRLRMPDAGLAQFELRRQLISDMREQDGEIVLGRDHADCLRVCPVGIAR